MQLLPPALLPLLMRRLRPLLLTLAGGCLLTVLCSWAYSRHLLSDAKLQQEVSGAQLTALVETRLTNQLEALRGLQNIFLTTPQLARQIFLNVADSQNLHGRLPGFYALTYSRVSPGNMPPDAQHGHPVQYVYPATQATLIYQDLDLFREENNAAALRQARDEGRPIATPPLPFGLTSAAAPMFAIHLPVYSPGPWPQGISERQRRYQGAVSAFFRLDSLLNSSQFPLLARMEALRVVDTGRALGQAAAGAETLLYESRPLSAKERARWLCSAHTLNIPGRQWRLESCATSQRLMPFYQSGWWLVLLGGLSLTLLLGITVLLHTPPSSSPPAGEATITPRAPQESYWQKLETIVEGTYDLLVIRDAQGKIEYANPAARQYFLLDSAPADKPAMPLLTTAELSELADPLVVPCRHHTSNGELVHYEATVIPIRSPFGCNQGSALLARDITRQVAQTEELHHVRSQLADLLELSGDWLWEQGLDGRFSYLSGGPFKLLDANPLHAIQRSRWDIGLGHLSESEWLLHQKIIAEHGRYNKQRLSVKSGSEERVISLSGKPLHDHDGVFIGYRGVGRDITTPDQEQAALHADKLKIMATLDSLSDGVITVDLDGQVEYMNPVALSLTGHEVEEAIGQKVETIFQVIDSETRLPLPSLARQALHGGSRLPPHRNAILLNRFGLTFSIQEAVTSIRDEKGETLGSVIVFRDLSDWLALSAKMDKAAH